MGCMGRLGCLILIVILAICAWFTRGMWLGRVRGVGLLDGDLR